MENKTGRIEDKGPIRLDTGVYPSLPGFPFHHEHPVGENSAKLSLTHQTWLSFSQG
jgi:hypothetical protein